MDKRYQVFISSTFSDLEDERKYVMETIINLNCFPAGMEMFPATDTEQFEFIKTVIDKSDYYVIIVAGRYGSVANDGISYTEKEYLYAKDKGIPILAFLRNDIESIPANKTENDPKKKKQLKSFRKKISEGRLVKYWNNVYELQYELFISLSQEFNIHPRIGWIRGNVSAGIELLEENRKLQEENKGLSKQIEELKKDGEKRTNDNLDKVYQKLKKEFIIFYNTYAYRDNMLIRTPISIHEILLKTGLFLEMGVNKIEFKELIEDRVINIEKQSDPELSKNSLTDILTKMLSLELITMEQDKMQEIVKLTRFGLSILYDLSFL